MDDDVPTDAELVAAARAGEVSGLGVLLERHRATMKAVAVGVLGFGPAADDVVQDAMVIALRHLGELRDPQAAGPWLRSIVRNACRMRLRSARPTERLTGVGTSLVWLEWPSSPRPAST